MFGPGSSCMAGELRRRNLQRTRLSAKYAKRLNAGLRWFQEWLVRRHIAVNVFTRSAKIADRLCVKFIQWAYGSHCYFHRVRDVVLGIQTRWRSLRHRLPRAWDSLASWWAELPVRSRIPIPVSLRDVVFFSAVLEAVLQQGMATAVRLLTSTAMWILGEDALLRPSELLSLQSSDIILPMVQSSPMAVVIREPNTPMTAGRVQHALAQCPRVIAWTTCPNGGRGTGVPLWPYCIQQARHMSKKISVDMGVDSIGFYLSSLRAGGATRLYLRGLDLSRIRFRGRWLNEGSVAIYIQEAVCALSLTVLPLSHREYLQSLIAEAHFTATPPSRPLALWVLNDMMPQPFARLGSSDSLDELLRCARRAAVLGGSRAGVTFAELEQDDAALLSIASSEGVKTGNVVLQRAFAKFVLAAREVRAMLPGWAFLSLSRRSPGADRPKYHCRIRTRNSSHFRRRRRHHMLSIKRRLS